MSSESGKSRRRFLADMLFLGGGVTAAALLAKTQLSTPDPAPTTPPDVAGEVVCPEQPVPAGAVPAPDLSPKPEALPGEFVPPQAHPSDIPIQIGGKPIAPKSPQEYR